LSLPSPKFVSNPKDMKQNIKKNILHSIGEVYERSEDCKLKASHFKKMDNELTHLSTYFKTTKKQPFFTAMVFALNYKGDTVDFKGLIEYFNCNPMDLLVYNNDLEYLYEKGIFIKTKSSRRVNVKGANDQFSVNENISKAILENKPMPSLEKESFKDIVELLEEIYDLGIQRDEGEISTFEMFRKTNKIIQTNLHYLIIKIVNDYAFDIADAHLYLYLIWKTISGHESVSIARAVEGVFDNPSKRVMYMQKVMSGENDLIKNDLFDLVPARFFNDTEMKLTDKSLDILTQSGIKLFVNTKKGDNIIAPTEIASKKLIYDEEEMKQLALLNSLLQDAKLSEVQSRLVDKSLPKGITVLLHGAPGTGKTETSLQIAKASNREIMKVEISQSKSMWFGESEKIIKRIFTDYNSFANKCEQTPILLFNEADALISKRVDISNSNTGQTENTIQNILLEELENFEGILIATTNLADNLDAAFERRFLFKIKFQNPDLSIKTKIWKLKLPKLTEVNCKKLAAEFDFSGGQIDNIIRKNEINEIIYGASTSFKSILAFCREEFLSSRTTQIGFTKS
jgi:AAA+ superfamily predicted ATPase